MFGRNKKMTIDLIDFSIMHISTGKIGSYIVGVLYKQLGFTHIGYRIENMDGDIRCILYTLKGNKKPVRYFKDRCSGMIEEKVQSIDDVPFKINKWGNGFEEICE